MATHEPRNPDFGACVRRDFAAQGAMRLLGASLTLVQPGVVAIEFAHRDELAQQHGFIHAGILATALDSACGFAALTLMPPQSSVVSVEFKINLLRPAMGELFRAVATVRRHGRTLSVCNADAIAIRGDEEKLVATMQGTMMCLGETTKGSDAEGE